MKRGGAQMSPTLRLKETIWRWYCVLLIANALDLLFTYVAMGRGIPELNPLLQPIVLTPWPPVLKLATFCFLAYGLWQIVRRPGSARRILALLQSTAVIYLIVIAIHLVGLRLLRV